MRGLPGFIGHGHGMPRLGAWRTLAGVVAGVVLGQALLLVHPGGVAAAGTHSAVLQVWIHNDAHQVVSSVAAGSPVHLRATVIPLVNGDPFPSGSVGVIYYLDGTCTTPGGSRSGSIVLGIADPAGTPVFPARAGMMSFIATYEGDAWFAPKSSACLPLTVTRASPTVALWLGLSGVEISTMVAGRYIGYELTVSGPTGVVPATGAAQLKFHSGTTCSSPVFSAGLLLTNGTDSYRLMMAPAGEYSVNATYEGDANWLPGAFAGCRLLTVTRAPSTLTTTIHDDGHVAVTTVAAGAVIHPRVVIATGVQLAPTGILRARAYADAACTTPSGSSVDAQVVSGRYDGTADLTDLAIIATPGIHAVRVEYGGDGSFLPVEGACTSYAVTGGTPTNPPPTNPPPTNPPPTNPSPTNPAPTAASPTASIETTVPTANPIESVPIPGETFVALPGASNAGDPTGDPAGSIQPGSSLIEGSAATAAATFDDAASDPAASGLPADRAAAGGSSIDVGIVALLAVIAGGLAVAGAIELGLRRRRAR